MPRLSHLSITKVFSFLMIMFSLLRMCPLTLSAVSSVRNKMGLSILLLQSESLTNFVDQVFDNPFKMSEMRKALQIMTTHFHSGRHRSINHTPTYYQSSTEKMPRAGRYARSSIFSSQFNLSSCITDVSLKWIPFWTTILTLSLNHVRDISVCTAHLYHFPFTESFLP